jgi:hypothetical protein
MNWNYFSLIGYLSVLLWVSVPVLWAMNRLRRTSRWLCPIALGVAVLAFAFAKVNSKTHVNRIEPDLSGQVAELQAREEAKRKAAEDGRGEDVAQIRFAEDASGDFLDKAGMDQADLKYMESVSQSSEPEWKKAKKAKKSRSSGGEEDGDLDSMLGGDKAITGVETDKLEEGAGPEPILMKDSDMARAHRLDGMNLTVSKVLIALAVLMVVFDYLRRANIYQIASRPFPLPSAWVNGFTPHPPVVVRPASARRSMMEELAWLAKRGDSFVYVTDDDQAAAGILSSLPRLGKSRGPVDVMHVTAEGCEISDDFIFESLWYGRGCFVVNSADRAERMLARFLGLLEERKKVRARVSQTAHVVWDAKHPLSGPQTIAFARLAKATGFSWFECSGTISGSPAAESEKDERLPA